jgi:hypothetical protein
LVTKAFSDKNNSSMSMILIYRISHHINITYKKAFILGVCKLCEILGSHTGVTVSTANAIL